MANKCKLTKKKANFGNSVSHANNKNKKKQSINLVKKLFYIPSLKKSVTLRVSTKAVKIINRIGIEAAMKKKGLVAKELI